jgi:hypothetical protein
VEDTAINIWNLAQGPYSKDRDIKFALNFIKSYLPYFDPREHEEPFDFGTVVVTDLSDLALTSNRLLCS